MKYWTISRFGEIHVGKADSWRQVSLSYGDRLYNPYTKRPVIGWNEYKRQIAKGQKENLFKR